MSCSRRCSPSWFRSRGCGESFGVTPAAVVGHSQGEIAAAHVAGALSLDDAARVVAARSQVLRDTLSGRGGMVSVGTSVERVDGYLRASGGRVSLAAVNGPSAVVVSGQPEALDELIAACEADGIRAKRLPVDYAAHSAQIELLRERLLRELGPVAPRPAEVPLYSTVTGERTDTTGMDAEYWYRNLRQTVRFAPALRAMAEDGVSAVVEVSPHPVLSTAALETIEAAGIDPQAVAVISSLRRQEGGLERFIRSLSEAHAAGIDVDWRPLFAAQSGARVPLPTYAFQHRRYWLSPGGVGTNDPRSLGQAAADHPLLDAVLSLPGGQGTVLTGRLSLDRHQWLADHVVMGAVLLPAAAFLELALHAGAYTGAEVVEELTLGAPLLLDDEHAVAIHVTVSEPDGDGRRQLAIHSRPESSERSGDWTTHATGALIPDTATEPEPQLPSRADAAAEVDVEVAYERLSASGYDYGPAFRGLRRITSAGDELVVEVALDDTQATKPDGFRLHPVLADGALQAIVLAGLDAQTAGRPEVPFSFTHVRVHGGGASSMRAQIRHDGATWSVVAVDDWGTPVLSAQSVGMRGIEAGDLRGAHQAARDNLYEVQWAHCQAPGPDVAAPHLAVLGDELRLEAVAPDAEYHRDLEALLESVASGAPMPDRVVVSAGVPGSDGDLPGAVQTLTEDTLELLKAWLAFEPTAASKLVVITHEALAVAEADRPNLFHAALPGLLRSAHTEHPDRVGLVDIDDSDASLAAVLAALMTDESELAIRQGVLHAPRLSASPAEMPPATRSGARAVARGDRFTGDSGEPVDHPQSEGERSARPGAGPGCGATPRA